MNSQIKVAILIIAPLMIGLMIPDMRNSGKVLPYVDADSSGLLNPEHLDGPFTGGFGELTCHTCHFDYDMNMLDRGRLELSGFGEGSKFRPGETHELTITIQSDHLEIGGFQMTTRFEDGTQAGDFEWESGRLMYTPNIENDVLYLQHSRDGTSPTSDRTVTWTFQWMAPDNADRPVHIHIAANAGNDDDSAFGDWIYTKELEIQPFRIE